MQHLAGGDAGGAGADHANARAPATRRALPMSLLSTRLHRAAMLVHPSPAACERTRTDSLPAVPDPDRTVRDVMSTDAPTAGADDTLLVACRQIDVGGMGSVPVIDAAGECVGVLSGWDVVRAIGQGAELDSTTAAEVVGGDGVVHPDDDFVRRSAPSQVGIVIPVVEEDGLYVGAVGPADVLAARA